MVVSASFIESTTVVSLNIVTNKYSEYPLVVRISNDMWQYLRVIGIEAHRTLMQLVNEQLSA